MTDGPMGAHEAAAHRRRVVQGAGGSPPGWLAASRYQGDQRDARERRTHPADGFRRRPSPAETRSSVSRPGRNASLSGARTVCGQLAVASLRHLAASASSSITSSRRAIQSMRRGFEAIELAHRRHDIRPLRDARPDLPSSFVNVIERARRRPASDIRPPGRFGNALAASVGAPPSKPEEKFARPRFEWWS